ncbi:MAG: hypothetical protein U9R75_03220 [Candidatus Thermoplasmatota archaeon]|nr:hypothetical protein [Candidatus Thermoplasmatota archaeon]
MKCNKTVLVLVLIVSITASSGCLDMYTTKGLFFPSEDISHGFVQGTIAEVSHNFTGGVGDDNIQVMTQEERFEVDNFHIGVGGADLYIWAQVHFGSDSERTVDYTRSIEVTLYYMPEEGENILKARKVYRAPDVGRYDVAEIMGQIEGGEQGLWSLRVFGNGTASSTADIPFYDWFQVTVNGRYSDDSYNNDAPGKGSS